MFEGGDIWWKIPKKFLPMELWTTEIESTVKIANHFYKVLWKYTLYVGYFIKQKYKKSNFMYWKHVWH